MTACNTPAMRPLPSGGQDLYRVGGHYAAMDDVLTFAVLLAATVLLDALARPRAARAFPFMGRRAPGLWLLTCLTTAVFGLSLALCGSVTVAACMALALQALFVLASNAKRTVLGEPLLFSDLALIGAIFRHPQFYLSAIRLWQRFAIAGVAAVLIAVLAWFFVPDPLPHLAGAAVLALGLGALALTLRAAPIRILAPVPDADRDVERLGLMPSLLLYWLRWRESGDPPFCAAIERHPPTAEAELLVIVQCESFADPVTLFGDPTLALPGLAAARAGAFQQGRLDVSGFGAYTMRTEYGVLFGRDEPELGFRRYDPFLTALGEASYALPQRLAGAAWRGLFLHPHDMRFYGRDRIMPAGGFAELVGEDRFAPPAAGEGRYVTDAAMTDEIVALASAATERSMIYAVTIENHGPWAPERRESAGDLAPGYMRLVRHSDAMLASLVERLSKLGRPAVLVFFGDHRPSIPGATAPGGDRYTPYVMIRIDAAGRVDAGDHRQLDLTPAGLHHAILAEVLGEPA